MRGQHRVRIRHPHKGGQDGKENKEVGDKKQVFAGLHSTFFVDGGGDLPLFLGWGSYFCLGAGRLKAALPRAFLLLKMAQGAYLSLFWAARGIALIQFQHRLWLGYPDNITLLCDR